MKKEGDFVIFFCLLRILNFKVGRFTLHFRINVGGCFSILVNITFRSLVVFESRYAVENNLVFDLKQVIIKIFLALLVLRPVFFVVNFSRNSWSKPKIIVPQWGQNIKKVAFQFSGPQI